jgi:hypothetical protein
MGTSPKKNSWCLINMFNEFCTSSYQNNFELKLSQLDSTDQSRREAQKYAMKQSFRESIERFPDQCPATLWKHIHEAHVSLFTGLKIPKKDIEKVISADQSWKKSSGHAFEEFLKNICNPLLLPQGLELLLQRDISELRNENRLLIEPRDLDWLQAQLDSSTFDLYLCMQQQESYKVFGCVQAKTSIRDRVTRDREPSIQAMNSFYISLAIVLDGEYLKNPKFQEMVNGGTKRYPQNGWHAMYVFSKKPTVELGRIKSLDANLNPLIQDCKKCANSWMSNRQWIDQDWLI